jgi:site-specific DNA-methyltransferase (adenine-specific)/adenine-specific DNA-methyltransferase
MGLWRSDNLSVKTYSADYDYPIENPITKELYYPPKSRCWMSNKEQIIKWINEGRIFFGRNGKGAPQLKRYLNEVQAGIVPITYWSYDEVGHNDESKKELKRIFPELTFAFDTPKPTRLIQRILQLSTGKNDLILDSFAGSGTTGHAVLQLNKEDGGNRKFILVEMEEKICKEITAERIKRVIKGYEYAKANGDTEKVEGLGGGFNFCSLDEPLFDELGNINKNVKYKELASHVFFSETGIPISEGQEKDFPLIGIFDNTVFYLLYNGILGDKTVNGGNILTKKMLESLPKFDGKKVVFAAGSRINPQKLQKENIFFKQTPYELRIS